MPSSHDSLAKEVLRFARDANLMLDPEQELILGSSVGLRENGLWQAKEIGCNVPRQNGKGEVLMARELAGLFLLGERKIIHSAHEFKTSADHFNRVEAVIRENDDLHRQVKRSHTGRITGYRYSHGEESITLQSGAVIEFRTRTKSGMRGFQGVDLLVLDEAMIISEAAHSASMPIIRASKAMRGPQLWYTGSAVDQTIHDHGVVWTRVRERGMAGDDDALVYLEWSLDFEHPDEVPDSITDDPVQWRKVNFAMGHGRITEEHMSWERRAMSDRGFKVELLGVGDPPPTDGSVDTLISPEEWADVMDSESVMTDPVCIAFDVSPERHSSVVAAGIDEHGHLLVELIHSRSGTGWLSERLVELYRSHEVAEVVCDGFGPSAAIAKRVDEAGITVRRMDSGDYGKACGFFVDAVGEKTLRHLGQPELDQAIRGARARPLVDRWAWSRIKSTLNISPLVAATLALWSASENAVGEVTIF